MYINCCKDCVPPKRNPSCHSTCKEYLMEREKHLKNKEEINKEKMINNDITGSIISRIGKHHRRKPKNY